MDIRQPDPGQQVEGSTIPAVFDAIARRLPGAPAVYYRDTTRTIAELDSESDACARVLMTNGVERGSRVAVMLQNVPEYVVVALAAWKLGAVVVPVNPMYTVRELDVLLNDSAAVLVVAHPGSALDGAAVDLPRLLVLADDEPESLPRAEDLAAAIADELATPSDRVASSREQANLPTLDPPLSPDEVAILPYTSGTTGPPKGARVTHANALAQSLLFRDWFGLDADDCLLAVSPLSHITGLVAHLGVCLVTPMPIVLDYRFRAAEMAALCQQHQCTFTVGAITIFHAFLRDDLVSAEQLKTLRHVVSGGAPVPAAVVDEVASRLGIIISPTYGLTETTSSTHLVPNEARPPRDPESGALSVGLPVTGVQTRIVDEHRAPVAAGQRGEIEVRGPGLVDGYWQRPDESATAIVDGWLRTGDVGFVDSEGWLFVVDRMKDMIVASGFKVWPREVEDVLYEHPDVAECAVVGVPDPYRGESVMAYVVPRRGGSPSPEDLISFCRERMAAYKYPRVVVFVDELPKTTSGKVLRRHLRARGTAEPAQPTLQGDP